MLEPALVNEIKIIHLIYTKYRAQQRSQRWWKYFAILHRRLLRFVQANRIDTNSARFIVDKLTPPAARAFHMILTQGAFITLGFALLAALARVRTLLLPHVPVKTVQQKAAIFRTIDEDVGEAVLPANGEEEHPKVSKSNKPTEPLSKPSKSSKLGGGKSSKSSGERKAGKKKRSGRSAIDDIFN